MPVKGQIFGLRNISDTNLRKNHTPLDNINILLIKRSNLLLHKSNCAFFNPGCVIIPPWQTAKASWCPTGSTLADLPGYHMGNQFMKPKLQRNHAKYHMDKLPVQMLLRVLVFLWKSGLSEFFLLLKYCVRHLSTRSSLRSTPAVNAFSF